MDVESCNRLRGMFEPYSLPLSSSHLTTPKPSSSSLLFPIHHASTFSCSFSLSILSVSPQCIEIFKDLSVSAIISIKNRFPMEISVITILLISITNILYFLINTNTCSLKEPLIPTISLCLTHTNGHRWPNTYTKQPTTHPSSNTSTCLR